VLVYDENAARGKWPLGKIIEVYPDRSNRVRQVLVKTVTSTLRRPISKLYKIIDGNESNDPRLKSIMLNVMFLSVKYLFDIVFL